MLAAAEALEFERAAALRDRIAQLQQALGQKVSDVQFKSYSPHAVPAIAAAKARARSPSRSGSRRRRQEISLAAEALKIIHAESGWPQEPVRALVERGARLIEFEAVLQGPGRGRVGGGHHCQCPPRGCDRLGEPAGLGIGCRQNVEQSRRFAAGQLDGPLGQFDGLVAIADRGFRAGRQYPGGLKQNWDLVRLQSKCFSPVVYRLLVLGLIPQEDAHQVCACASPGLTSSTWRQTEVARAPSPPT